MPRIRRKRGHQAAREPFSALVPFILHDEAAVDAYWREYRDEWIADHQLRHGPLSMPDRWWSEQGVLTADTDPIDWRDWSDPESWEVRYGVPTGQMSIGTMEHLARAKRLDGRRRAYLQEHAA